VLVLVVVAALACVRGPSSAGADDRLVREAIAAAHGAPILAEPASAERIALAGGRVWISNPLDAFSSADQRAYLDWLQGRAAGNRLLRKAQVVVVVSQASPAGRALRASRRYRAAVASSTMQVFVRLRS